MESCLLPPMMITSPYCGIPGSHIYPAAKKWTMLIR